MLKNKFATYCARCYWRVEVGQGNVRKEGGKWITEHGQCPEAAIAQKKKDAEYMAQLRREVLADPKCKAWLSSKGRYV